MNEQPILKQDLSRDGVHKPLQVAEVFNSIQGEGPFSGHWCTFIRLAGCNLKCTWCDTSYAPEYLHRVDDLVKLATAPTVVITGGEPFRQNIGPLAQALVRAGKIVQIETNGTLTNPGFPFDYVHIVCSPKAGKVHKDIQEHASAFKYVVDANTVGPFPTAPTQHNGVGTPSKPDSSAPVYYMPLTDENESANTARAVVLCEQYGGILCLRLHNILNMR